MPYVRVQPEELQVGKEYVLTLKGIESRIEGAEYETVPVYNYGYTPPGKVPKQTGTRTQMKMPASVVAPPTAERQLLDAYRALQTWQRKDAPGSYMSRLSASAVDINRIRRKGFFAGVNTAGLLIFTQERSFGSSKPVAFIPVDVNEKNRYGFSLHPGLSKNDYAFWKLQGNNNTRRNGNGNGKNGNGKNGNLVLGNLLGENKQKALNNAYNQHMMEQNLKGVLSGGRRRKTRRSRTY